MASVICPACGETRQVERLRKRVALCRSCGRKKAAQEKKAPHTYYSQCVDCGQTKAAGLGKRCRECAAEKQKKGIPTYAQCQQCSAEKSKTINRLCRSCALRNRRQHPEGKCIDCGKSIDYRNTRCKIDASIAQTFLISYTQCEGCGNQKPKTTSPLCRICVALTKRTRTHYDCCQRCGGPTHRRTLEPFCKECAARRSAGEIEVAEFVKSSCDSIIKEGYWKAITNPRTGRPLELDIYIPELALAIEFNGSYWHSDAQARAAGYISAEDRHRLKLELCQAAGITVAFVWQEDWESSRDTTKAALRDFLDSRGVEVPSLLSRLVPRS